MEILDSEKRRARNLIWNAAADYSFEPDFKAYDEDGIEVEVICNLTEIERYAENELAA